MCGTEQVQNHIVYQRRKWVLIPCQMY